jgi:hypothetical protein
MLNLLGESIGTAKILLLVNYRVPTATGASDHIRSAEVDSAPAAQRRGVLDEDDLFVVAHALQDLFGFD